MTDEVAFVHVTLGLVEHRVRVVALSGQGDRLGQRAPRLLPIGEGAGVAPATDGAEPRVTITDVAAVLAGLQVAHPRVWEAETKINLRGASTPALRRAEQFEFERPPAGHLGRPVPLSGMARLPFTDT